MIAMSARTMNAMYISHSSEWDCNKADGSAFHTAISTNSLWKVFIEESKGVIPASSWQRPQTFLSLTTTLTMSCR